MTLYVTNMILLFFCLILVLIIFHSATKSIVILQAELDLVKKEKNLERETLDKLLEKGTFVIMF